MCGNLWPEGEVIMNTGNQVNSGFDSIVRATAEGNGSLDEKKNRLISKLNAILSQYTTEKVAFDDRLVDIIRKLDRKRKEFHATRFFVLVVGPVKSGKSTLVNIFARKYVSPTAYKECTALPTIIGKSKGPHLNKIVQYIPTTAYGDDENRKVTFDYIVDVIREIESPDVLSGRITTKESDLTTHNVREIVTLYHDDEIMQNDLVVSMGVEGDGFIDDEIMLIDMPGLDGGVRHKENTLIYNDMAQRADVVFFVQSTTSAINKGSIDFLNELFVGKQGKVPVWLIHNVHESQYFLKDDEKKVADIQEQIQLGRKRVEEGFGIHRFKHLVLNLGKVYAAINEKDRAKEECRTEIDDAYSKYIEIEKELIETLKTERRAIKDENNIGKAEDVIKESVKVIENIAKDLDSEIVTINNRINYINNLSFELDNVEINNTEFLDKYEKMQETIEESWELIIKQRIDAEKSLVDKRSKMMPRTELKRQLDSIKEECLSKFPVTSGSKFRLELVAEIKSAAKPYVEKTNYIKEALQEVLPQKNIEIKSEINKFISDGLAYKPNSFDFVHKRKLWLPYYKTGTQITYLDEIKQHIDGEIKSKCDEYRKIIENDFRMIFDRYINEMKQSIVPYAKEYEEQQNNVIIQKQKQIDLLNALKQELLS